MNSEVFADLADCQLLELTKNYRAINDPEYKVFLDDMMKIREGKTINFNKYGKKECRKSICWTIKCLDGSPLHSDMQELGHQNFKIEVVEKVPYIDDEQLLIAETANIIKFNSIEFGYNTKLSVSLENLY
jgi:hypothetical protein